MSTIEVEVAYAQPDRQELIRVRLTSGSTAIEAVAASGLLERLGEGACRALGIFGRRCAADCQLSDGDRVEIYRPLLFDPKDSRRRRAAKGR